MRQTEKNTLDELLSRETISYSAPKLITGSRLQLDVLEVSS